jgi:hypothetical protein
MSVNIQKTTENVCYVQNTLTVCTSTVHLSDYLKKSNEGRKKRGRPRRTWKDGIYTAMSERDLRMGEWNNQRQWNMEVGRRHQTF